MPIHLPFSPCVAFAAIFAASVGMGRGHAFGGGEPGVTVVDLNGFGGTGETLPGVRLNPNIGLRQRIASIPVPGVRSLLQHWGQ